MGITNGDAGRGKSHSHQKVGKGYTRIAENFRKLLNNKHLPCDVRRELLSDPRIQALFEAVNCKGGN